MNLTIGPQIRIVALVGLLAALGLAGSMFLLGGSGSKTPAEPSPARTATTPATPAKAHATPAKPAHQTTAKQVAAPRTPAKKAKPAGYRGNPVYATLPRALQWQLAHHKVVVVSIYNPRSDVDAISVAEAHAGAVTAGAGFLLVSVLDNKVAGILTGLLPNGGLLPDPGVLVYKAPGEIAIRLDGFADRDAVAQAATNAISGEMGPAAPATTAPVTPVAAAPTGTTFVP